MNKRAKLTLGLVLIAASIVVALGCIISFSNDRPFYKGLNAYPVTAVKVIPVRDHPLESQLAVRVKNNTDTYPDGFVVRVSCASNYWHYWNDIVQYFALSGKLAPHEEREYVLNTPLAALPWTCQATVKDIAIDGPCSLC